MFAPNKQSQMERIKSSLQMAHISNRGRWHKKTAYNYGEEHAHEAPLKINY
jgi:hypothetical protein